MLSKYHARTKFAKVIPTPQNNISIANIIHLLKLKCNIKEEKDLYDHSSRTTRKSYLRISIY